jgi:hypothetical protein
MSLTTHASTDLKYMNNVKLPQIVDKAIRPAHGTSDIVENILFIPSGIYDLTSLFDFSLYLGRVENIKFFVFILLHFWFERHH